MLPGPDVALYTTSFSPVNAHIVATASNDGTLRVWDTQNRLFSGRAEPSNVGIASAEFSHNGQLLVTAGNTSDQAKIYHVGNLQHPVGVLNLAKYSKCSNLSSTTASAMNSATFSPNGQQVITADQMG